MIHSKIPFKWNKVSLCSLSWNELCKPGWPQTREVSWAILLDCATTGSLAFIHINYKTTQQKTCDCKIVHLTKASTTKPDKFNHPYPHKTESTSANCPLAFTLELWQAYHPTNTQNKNFDLLGAESSFLVYFIPLCRLTKAGLELSQIHLLMSPLGHWVYIRFLL